MGDRYDEQAESLTARIGEATGVTWAPGAEVPSVIATALRAAADEARREERADVDRLTRERDACARERDEARAECRLHVDDVAEWAAREALNELEALVAALDEPQHDVACSAWHSEQYRCRCAYASRRAAWERARDYLRQHGRGA